MNNTSTQLESYYLTVADGLSKRRAQVLRFIIKQNKPVTRHDISKGTRLPLQTICGRINELIEMNVIKVAGENFEESTQRFCEALTLPDSINAVRPLREKRGLKEINKELTEELEEMRIYTDYLYKFGVNNSAYIPFDLKEWRDRRRK